MKKAAAVLLSLGLVFGFSYGADHVAEAKTKVKVYKNCKELNKVYKGGVARTSKEKTKAEKQSTSLTSLRTFMMPIKRKTAIKILSPVNGK